MTMARLAALAVPWACFFLAFSSFPVESFSPAPFENHFSAFGHYQKLLGAHPNANDNDHDSERRSFLKKSAASLVGIVATAPPPPADAIVEDSAVAPTVSQKHPDSSPAIVATGNFDCLLDLPPVTPGCVRIYLCRHGQTENNRLHVVQGARVDPPINENGKEQARRLGLAVSRLMAESRRGAGGGRGAVPALAAHSKLRRARETAEALASTATIASSSQYANRKGPALEIYGEVPSLGKVDFGSLGGIDVTYFRGAVRSTFASWSLGNIDRRAGRGGESGREVLERAALALEELSALATSSPPTSSAILAVSHSTYLRILLALVADVPLAESVLWKIQNGCVNVVDVDVTGKRRLVTSNSGIFGGEIVGALRGSNGLELEMPEAHLVRRNEVRHLDGMNV